MAAFGRLSEGAPAFRPVVAKAPPPQSATAHRGAPARTPGLERLFERIDQIEDIAEVFPGGLALFDRDLNMVVCNTRLKAMLDYSEALFANGNPHIEELFRFKASRGEYGPGDVDEQVRHRVDLVRRGEPHVYERERPNGTIIEVRGVPIGGGGFLTTYFDVTRQRQQAREIAVLVENFPGGVAMFDRTLTMVVCNTRLRTMLDYPDSLFADGNPNIADVFRFNAERGEYGPGDIDEQVSERMARVREHRAHEYERVRPDGTILEVRGIPLADGGFVTTYLDVTDKRTAQQKLAHLAHHDALTGLPNRVLLHDRLQQALATVKREGGGLALLYIDLDGFKPINDDHGHAVGDDVLKAVGERLREHVREMDTAARIGGDEFVVLQTRLDSARDAQALATRLIAAIGQPLTVGGKALTVGASIGIAQAPRHGTDVEELFRRADHALYRAKSGGGGQFALAEA